MTAININGFEVKFPFAPYDVQITYMEHVLNALESGGTALLESPTGTGKTISLLCASLAWLLARRSNNGVNGMLCPQIVYCSRTHSQITQVIQELRSSPYGHVSSVVLGSREHFCVNAEVTQLPNAVARNHSCRSLRSDGRCRFFNSVQRGAMMTSHERSRIMDMEDLRIEGRKEGFCPYYSERERSSDAHIAFMPYNYIMDPVLRKQLPFTVDKKCVVIIDEAHNLPSVLGSDGCVNLTALSLANCIQDCSRAIAMMQVGDALGSSDDKDVKITEQDMAAVKIVLKRLEDYIAEVDLNKPTSHSRNTSAEAPGDLVQDGPYMFIFLENCLITREVFLPSADDLGMRNIMSDAIKLLVKSEKTPSGMTAVLSFLDNIFSADEEDLSSYRFVIFESEESSGGKGRSQKCRTLGFWRLESVELQRLQNTVHSLILTSGTLSPIEHFAAELGIEAHIQLRGAHVIGPDQLGANILSTGPAGEKLNGSYAFRGSSDYRLALGMSIANLCRHVPGGTLVFFPSYGMLYGTVDFWQSGSGESKKTVWGLLNELKPVFTEPSNTSDLSAVVQRFKTKVDTGGKGAIFLAVCRGKISEGVNFADHHGRCVIVTGIPFANHTDLYVRLKREYITSVSTQRPKVNGKYFTGEDWYRSEALRAVSQCVGRVIRHKNDFGVIVFADERFKDYVTSIPSWIQPSLQVGTHFRDTYSALFNFFSNKKGVKSEGLQKPLRFPRGSSPALAPKIDKELLDKAHFHVEKQCRESMEEAARLQTSFRESCLEVPKPMKKSLSSLSALCNTGCTTPAPIVPPPKTSAQELLKNCSSKDFCSFLKKHLNSQNYEEFKILLAEIAILRKKAVHPTPEPTIPEQLHKIMNRLFNVFTVQKVCRVEELMDTFIRFIPGEIRSHYQAKWSNWEHNP